MLAVDDDTTASDDALTTRAIRVGHRLGRSPDLLLGVILGNLGMVAGGLVHGVQAPRGLLVNLAGALFSILVFEYAHGPDAVNPPQPFRGRDVDTGVTNE